MKRWKEDGHETCFLNRKIENRLESIFAHYPNARMCVCVSLWGQGQETNVNCECMIYLSIRNLMEKEMKWIEMIRMLTRRDESIKFCRNHHCVRKYTLYNIEFICVWRNLSAWNSIVCAHILFTCVNFWSDSKNTWIASTLYNILYFMNICFSSIAEPVCRAFTHTTM